ncbi:Stk1 family PASTA domain-containing Ser/Thr kinase [Spinactinospora alkalitolerans]
MATVYVAHDLRLDRRVALKVMHSSLAQDPHFVRRFINEAHSVAKLSHPNVVQVYDQGTDQGHVYLAMEYVPGRTLRDLLTARGRLDPRDALQVMVPVLAALGAAHQAGMVHRDVKPENVLLTEDGQVKVVDFGLARVVEATQQNLTKTGTLMGTAAYLAPEQISRSVSDARTDVYAAGIMLYELLTGRQPHTGESPIAIAYQHVNEDVPRPSRTVPGVPQEIDSLVTRATERDPRYRPGDAGQFLTSVFAVYQAMPETGPDMPLTRTPAAAGTEPATGEGSNSTLVVDLNEVDLPPAEYGDDGAPARRRPNLNYPLLLVGGVLLVALLGLGWWMLLGRYESVPDLVGMGQEQAQEELSGAGLKIEVSDERVYSDEAEEGMIAESTPAPDERILPGETVTVALSQGPQTVEMPDVVGRPVGEARELLEEQGITEIDEEETVSYEEAPGTVLSSDPSAGDGADREESVTLQVSAGFDLPDVVGLSQDDATRQLEENDLAVDVAEKPSDDVPKGEVMEQAPAAGESVGSGDTVTITVSSGPEEIEIPDVRGMKAKDARKQLEELGFTVKVTRILGGDRVGSYSPEGKAQEGAEIELFVSPFAPGGGGDDDDNDDNDDNGDNGRGRGRGGD